MYNAAIMMTVAIVLVIVFNDDPTALLIIVALVSDLKPFKYDRVTYLILSLLLDGALPMPGDTRCPVRSKDLPFLLDQSLDS